MTVSLFKSFKSYQLLNVFMLNTLATAAGVTVLGDLVFLGGIFI